MPQEPTIINTKLQPPRIADIIQREKFALPLLQFKNKKLITVTGGAGYGKTTLILDTVDKLGIKTIWYRLDKSDTDFITFFHYLSVGVRKIFPDLNNQIFSTLNDPESTNRQHTFLLSLFINDLGQINHEDIFIVLDDFHVVQNSKEIKNALEFILKHLPDRIHLVLISRAAIDLPLSRLRGMRKVLEIDEQSLSFDESEIRRLFLQIFNLPINKDHIKILYKKTNGWVSGLILFYHMLKGKSETEIGKLLSKFKGSKREIYTYLEENIFNQLTTKYQSFLIKTSFLSRLNPDFCNELQDITDSKAILSYLKENHLFTFSLDSEKEEYIYHDLLKDYLKEKLRAQSDENEIIELYAKIARLYEKRGNNKEALDLYVKAGCMEDTSRIIGLFAWRWVRQGQIQQIKSILNNIPKPYLKNDPWFQYLQAGLLSLSGQIKEAISGYGKALEAFRARQSDDGLNICLMELAISSFITSDYEKAEPLFKELLYGKTLPKSLEIMCLGYLIAISGHLGKISDSDKYFEKAISMLSEISDENQTKSLRAWILTTKSWRFYAQGRLTDAFENVQEALSLIQNADEHRLIAFCYIILSEIYLIQGHYDDSKTHAIKALDIIKEKGFKEVIFPVAYLLLGYSCLGTGLADEALSHAKKCLEISRETCNSAIQASAYLLFHDYYLTHTKDLKAAEKSALEGMKTIDHLQSPHIQGLLEIGLASVMIEKEKFNKALELLKRAEKRKKHSEYFQANVIFQYEHYYRKNNNMDEAKKALLKGLSLCEANGYDSLLLWKGKFIVPLLVEIYAEGKQKDYINYILQKIGPDAVDELLKMIENNPSPLIKNSTIDLFNVLRRNLSIGLKIHFFGKFKIVIGKEELSTDRWPSKKALQLLKYLILHRERGYIQKEVLMELLWPNEDPEKSLNRFHVCLATIRKTLEPNLAKGVPSAYIQSNGGAYMFDIGNNGCVDLENFSQEIKQAKTSNNPEEAIKHFLNAISLYIGDFLEEDLYIDWCIEVRERFKEDYLYALKEIIKFYEKRNELKKCVDYASTYLKTDKFDEEIYMVLMRCHSYLGNTAMMIKTFERCKKSILDELNCPLSQGTLELYQQLNTY